MVFDPSDPQVDMNDFERKDCTTLEFGLDLVEEMPEGIPEPRRWGLFRGCLLTPTMQVIR